MKLSLALGPRRVLSRQTAWGCLTSNLALPGSGSLVAGRISGYAQLLLGLGGLGISVVTGARFLVWYLANWSKLQDQYGDPFAGIGQLWLELRWPLLGLAIFGAGLLWGLATSLQIVHEAKTAERKQVPPKL